MEEALIGAISAFTLAIFGAGGVGIWVKKRNNNNENGGGGGKSGTGEESPVIPLLRSINSTLLTMTANQETVKVSLRSMDTNINSLRVDFARVEGRLSNQ